MFSDLKHPLPSARGTHAHTHTHSSAWSLCLRVSVCNCVVCVCNSWDPPKAMLCAFLCVICHLLCDGYQPDCGTLGPTVVVCEACLIILVAPCEDHTFWSSCLVVTLECLVAGFRAPSVHTAFRFSLWAGCACNLQLCLSYHGDSSHCDFRMVHVVGARLSCACHPHWKILVERTSRNCMWLPVTLLRCWALWVAPLPLVLSVGKFQCIQM